MVPAQKPGSVEDPEARQALFGLMGIMSAGRCRALFLGLIEGGKLTGTELRLVYQRNGWDWNGGSCAAQLSDIQRRLRGHGWHLVHLPCGGARLVAGENPRSRAGMVQAKPAVNRGAEHVKPDLAPRPAVPVSAHIIAARRALTIKPAEDGCCQYLVVREGRAVACGESARGTYCPRHRAAVAGVPYREGMF